MKILNIIVLSMVLTLVVQTARAACYSPDQYRAEQAIRFHTGLMVTGMLCQRTLQQNTYADYQNFTTRNQSVIRNEENRLIAYFRQTKQPDPERSFHTFRTDLANHLSMQAMQVSVGRFCQSYATPLKRAKTMQPDDFKRWIDTISLSQGPSSKPSCVAAQKQK